MKTGLKDTLIFVCGLAIGACGSWFVCKKHYEKKAEDEIASVEKAFTDRINEIEDEKNEALGIASKAIIKSNNYNKEDPGSRELLKNKSTLDGIIKAANTERVDYTHFYGDVEKNSKESIEVDDHPRDSDEDEGVDIQGSDATRLVNGSADSGHERLIYEITSDDYGKIIGYDYKELYYYKGDGIMVDENEDIIDNPEFLVGSVLDKSGFKSNDLGTIYIRNESVSSDFEVIKVLGTYA